MTCPVSWGINVTPSAPHVHSARDLLGLLAWCFCWRLCLTLSGASRSSHRLRLIYVRGSVRVRFGSAGIERLQESYLSPRSGVEDNIRLGGQFGKPFTARLFYLDADPRLWQTFA